MKDKYVALAQKPKSHWSDDEPLIHKDLLVYERDDRPEDIGLLDAGGTPLYRVRARIKMGFEK